MDPSDRRGSGSDPEEALRKAMKYYRIWIYTCNAILFLCVVVFVVLLAFVLGDYRMNFIPLPVYHPSLLYAYLALGVQGGVLQAVGCAGAILLSEKWLNVYWKIMMVLLVGDGLEGFVWIFIYNHLSSSLPGYMLNQLQNDYGVSVTLTSLWDRLQKESRCCGVQGAMEYNASAWIAPYRTQILSLDAALSNYAVPKSCCFPYGQNGDSIYENVTDSICIVSEESENIYSSGCLDAVQNWIQQNANILFIIGYCVLTFLKVCFLGILRYEIKEMVQKIKVLQGEVEAYQDITILQSPCRLRPRKPGDESGDDEPCSHAASIRRNTQPQIEMTSSQAPPTNGNNNNTNKQKDNAELDRLLTSCTT